MATVTTTSSFTWSGQHPVLSAAEGVDSLRYDHDGCLAVGCGFVAVEMMVVGILCLSS